MPRTVCLAAGWRKARRAASPPRDGSSPASVQPAPPAPAPSSPLAPLAAGFHDAVRVAAASCRPPARAPIAGLPGETAMTRRCPPRTPPAPTSPSRLCITLSRCPRRGGGGGPPGEAPRARVRARAPPARPRNGPRRPRCSAICPRSGWPKATDAPPEASPPPPHLAMMTLGGRGDFPVARAGLTRPPQCASRASLHGAWREQPVDAPRSTPRPGTDSPEPSPLAWESRSASGRLACHSNRGEGNGIPTAVANRPRWNGSATPDLAVSASAWARRPD